MGKKLPFGVTHEPRVADTKAVLLDISDHSGDSTMHVNTWWNGEGFTLFLDGDKKVNEIDLTWTQWDALKLAVKAIKKAERGAK